MSYGAGIWRVYLLKFIELKNIQLKDFSIFIGMRKMFQVKEALKYTTFSVK